MPEHLMVTAAEPSLRPVVLPETTVSDAAPAPPEGFPSPEFLGALYRFATVLFFFAFTYVFLLEQARYLNHFYLVILVALLFVVVPAVNGDQEARFRSCKP